MRCKVCNQNKATKEYRGWAMCGECIKKLCLFCSTHVDNLVFKVDCPGHDVRFDTKYNRFSADAQFNAEAKMEMEEE